MRAKALEEEGDCDMGVGGYELTDLEIKVLKEVRWKTVYTHFRQDPTTGRYNAILNLYYMGLTERTYLDFCEGGRVYKLSNLGKCVFRKIREDELFAHMMETGKPLLNGGR